MTPATSARTIGLKKMLMFAIVSGGDGTETLNDPKLVKFFESIFVIRLYNPKSGNRYFTE